MAKYSVTIGAPFVVDAVEVEEIEAVEKLAAIDERRSTAKHQVRITYAVLGFMAFAVGTTAVVGWYDGSYNELNAVWSAGSVWIGLVLGRYFKKE